MTAMLEALVERLESATCGLPGADADLFEALGLAGTVPPDVAFRLDGDRYTGSLDAALRLVDRVLPEWFYEVGKCRSGGFGAHLSVPDTRLSGVSGYIESAATPALAVCLALIRAVIDTRPSKARDENGATE